MRRESGVEDDGVLFINPSVSTQPSGGRGSDGNYLISCHLQMTPRTWRQNKIEKREKPNGEDGINNRRCRVSKKSIDTLILPGGGHRMTQNLER
jgi:hypothetical protein